MSGQLAKPHLRAVGMMDSDEVADAKRAEEKVDASLVRRASQGDDKAIRSLFERHARYVHGLAVQLLGGHPDAEDLTQDTFVIAFQNLGSLREPAKFRSWVSSITVRQANKRMRRLRLRKSSGLSKKGSSTSIG